MATNPVGRMIDRLRRAAPADGPTDGELVGRYTAGRDEVAFEALLRRHGPMVLGVCRRVLRNEADAHDAFQATFLVFVRKAATLRDPGRVGSWLYGVASHTARKAKAMNRKRRAKEAQADRPAADDIWQPLRELLDAELARLPETYRAAVVLCDLEGRTIKDAARHLGWPQGTVATRLTRGRALLARRLAAHGVPLPAVVLTAAVSHGSPALPPGLTAATVHAATTTGPVPAAVAALTEGVLKTMSSTKLRTLLTTLLAAGVLVAGAAVYPRPAPAQPSRFPDKPEKAGGGADKTQAVLLKQLEAVRWNLTDVDPEGKTIRVSDTPLPSFSGGLSQDNDVFGIHNGLLGLSDVPVAKDVKVTRDGKEAKLKDLRPGMEVALKFADGKPVVSAIDATSRRPEAYVVKAVDAEKRTITVAFGKDGELRDLPVARGVYIYLYDKGNEGKLSDVQVGMRVSLRVEVEKDQLVVKDLRARK